jgi:hypothetical protein
MENVDKKEEGLKQTIIINQAPAATSNGLGVAGFVCALVGLIFSWVPVFGWIVWALGLILSACGLIKQPRGLAIAGLVISLIGLIVLIILIAAVASVAATAL